MLEHTTSSCNSTQSCIFIHTADSSTSLATTIVNTIRFTASPQASHLYHNSLTYGTDQDHINKETDTGLAEKNNRKLKLPHKHDEYQEGAADPKNTPCWADAVYVTRYRKTKFQIQNHQTKIWPVDIPQRLSRVHGRNSGSKTPSSVGRRNLNV